IGAAPPDGGGKAQASQAVRVRVIEPYRPFPVTLLPEPIARYVIEGAAALGCDPAFVALPVLAVVASAVGDTRVIYVKRTWKEPCIIWSAVVADSGAMKSPAHQLTIGPVWALQKRLMRQHKEEAARYQGEKQEYEARKRLYEKAEKEKKGSG